MHRYLIGFLLGRGWRVWLQDSRGRQLRIDIRASDCLPSRGRSRAAPVDQGCEAATAAANGGEMKYLCLAYYDEKRFAALAAEELDAIRSACAPHDQALRASGHLLTVASLAATRDTVSIRPQRGTPRVTDGPYAETKEQLGSFFLIEAADRDEAVRIAALHPAARLNEELGWAIEVRPIEFFDQL
jgi:hypothetical protein